MTSMILVALVLVGLCLGSFVNALVWRTHQQSTAKTNKKRREFSISRGRSMCPHCKHSLAARDLVPVLSWLELRGRCRYCNKSISWQYPVVELSMAVLYCVSYLYWPYEFGWVGALQFIVWLGILVLLMALFVYDLHWMLLPNSLVYTLLGLVGLQTIIGLASGVPDVWFVLNLILGSIALGGVFWLLFQVSGGAWIGGGDVRLGFAIGLLAGSLINSVLLLFIASLLGTVVSLPLILQGKKASHKVPFGPFLITATVIVYLFGASINSWYQGLLFVAVF